MKKIILLILLSFMSFSAYAYNIQDAQYTALINGFFKGYGNGFLKQGVSPQVTGTYISQLKKRFNRQEFVNKTKGCIQRAKTPLQVQECCEPVFLDFLMKNSDLKDEFMSKAR